MVSAAVAVAIAGGVGVAGVDGVGMAMGLCVAVGAAVGGAVVAVGAPQPATANTVVRKSSASAFRMCIHPCHRYENTVCII
jgi:hypothetical protein